MFSSHAARARKGADLSHPRKSLSGRSALYYSDTELADPALLSVGDQDNFQTSEMLVKSCRLCNLYPVTDKHMRNNVFLPSLS